MFRRRFLSKRNRALVVLLVIFAILAVIAFGCSDDPLASPAHPDSGVPSAVLGDSVCPDAAPDADESCLLPEGTTCAFGACSARIAQCTFGSWRYSGNPPPRPPCPTDFPVAESACPPCWPMGVECTYGSCTAPDASTNTTVASCADAGAGQSERWALRSFPCTDASQEPLADAGADVQGDAEPDAD